LNEANLERTEGGEGQETGIEVDMDASDDKAVTRNPVSSKARPAGSARDQAWLDKSKDVQKRIGRMQRSFDQRMADQQAEFQRQLSAQRDEFIKLRAPTDAGADADEKTHDEAVALLQEALEAAQERGDSKAVARTTAELSTLNAKYWSAKTAKMTGSPATAAKTAPSGARQPTQAGKKWTDANTEWWNDITDTDSASARGMANNLHAKFISEGSDPNTDAHYEKIRRLIAKRFPEVNTITTVKRKELDDEGEDVDTEADEGAARRVVQPRIQDRGNPSNRRSNVRTLSAKDLKDMRAVNLDPNNNKHVVAYLKSGNEMAEDDA
jgi:hypothetical protein